MGRDALLRLPCGRSAFDPFDDEHECPKCAVQIVVHPTGGYCHLCGDWWPLNEVECKHAIAQPKPRSAASTSDTPTEDSHGG